MNDKHPLALSEAERQQSLALLDDEGIDGDPAAGTGAAVATTDEPAHKGKTAGAADDADGGAQDDEDDVGKGAAKEGEQLDPEALKAVAEGTDGGDKNDQIMIPKGRFDQVLGELKEVKGKLGQMQAQHAAAVAPIGTARDWAAEKKALKAKYDAGEIDQSEYLDKRDDLVLDQSRYEARAEQQKVQVESSKAGAQSTWDEKIGSWSKTHAAFLDNSVRRDAFERAIERIGKDTTLSDDQVIEKAQKESFEAFNYTAAAAASATKKDPHADRNARDATAQAQASATPSPAAGGHGDRGRDVGGSVLDMKPGAVLTKEQRARYLDE